MGMAGSGVTGCGWPPVWSTCQRAHRNDNQQRHGEQVGGNHEDHAGVVDAAHVDDGENEQHPKAELQRVRLQAGHGGDERAHAGGDAHRCGEDVVDHQRRSGQQAGALAQVLRSHRVGAAALRIGVDGLAIAEVRR